MTKRRAALTANKQFLDAMPHLRDRDVGDMPASSASSKQIFHRRAETNLPTRQADHVDEAAVEQNNSQVDVEHAKTLRHPVHRDGVKREKGTEFAG